ncbi:MAG: response regulator [Anaerolineales bacterium]|nr:response regulator [Anaerolineales bacterium]
MGLHIFVVDDNEVNLTLVAKIMEMEGYRVTTACCGQEALQGFIQFQPDLVVLDVNMPDIDGFTVCRRLREPPINATVPIIMLSATAEESDRRQALNSGANDMISKPFDMEDLRDRIRSLVG